MTAADPTPEHLRPAVADTDARRRKKLIGNVALALGAALALVAGNECATSNLHTYGAFGLCVAPPLSFACLMFGIWMRAKGDEVRGTTN